MRVGQFAWAVLLIAGLWATGCSPPPGEAAPAEGPEPTTAATDEEAAAAARALEAVVRSGDRSRAMQEFTLEVVAHRVAAGLPLAPGRLPDVLKVLPARADTNEIADLIVAEVGRGGGFRLLDVRPADGRHRARFRLSTAESSVDYYDVVLARFPSGRVGIEEVVRLSNGVRLTDIIREEILPAAALRDPGLDARLGEADRLDLAHSAQLEDLRRAYRDGKWAEARKLYEALPAGVRDRKPARFQHARAHFRGASRADQEAAVAACREQYPGDPASDLLALDFHLMRREHGAILEALAALRGSVGADAMLDAIEAVALARIGQPRAAAAAADRALKADPELRAAYAGRIAAAVEAEDHAATLEWMQRAVERTGLRFGDLRRSPMYAAFVRSPQYREWVTWQARRGADR